MIFPGGISWSLQCWRSSKCVAENCIFTKQTILSAIQQLKHMTKKFINNNLIFYYSVPNMDLLLKAQIRRKLSPHKTSGQTTPQSRTTHTTFSGSHAFYGDRAALHRPTVMVPVLHLIRSLSFNTYPRGRR